MPPRAEAPTTPADRLDSWKEIASYLKRDVRTLQRWEKEEGLPVHRQPHSKQGSVYAYRPEIDSWWESRRRELETRAARSATSRRIALGTAAVTAVIMVVLAVRLLTRSAPLEVTFEQPFFQFPVLLPNDSLGASLSISADGRRLSFNTCCTDRRIWQHVFASGVTSPVPGTEEAVWSFWSPDSSRLAFFAGGKLKVLDVTDPKQGPPVTLADTQGFDGSWGADGAILFSGGRKLFRIPPGGAIAPIAVTDDAGEYAARRAPRPLPDGRHFIYYVSNAARFGVYLGALDGSTAVRLVASELPAVFVKPSHLIYMRGTMLVAQRLNVNAGTLEGAPIPLTADAAPGGLSVPVRFAAADTGALAFVPTRGGRRSRLLWTDRAGTVVAPLPEVGDAEFMNPAIAPSGAQVALNRMDPQTGNWDIWIVDVARGIPSRVTYDGAQDSDPIWSPDEKSLVFASTRGGGLALYRKTIGSVQPEEQVYRPERSGTLIPSDWSRDGRFIVFTGLLPGAQTTIWVLPMTGERKPFRLPGIETYAYDARISPDGKWIAYCAFETGASQIYVQRFPEAGAKSQITSSGGAHPRWSSDGRELIYWASPRGLAAVTLAFSGDTVRAGKARTIAGRPIPNLIDARTHYDVARDGRMLVRQPIDDTPASITVFSNWMKAATLGSLPGAGAAAGSRDSASRGARPLSGDR
jgi:eukaryotic-like serine/threonine-protein kinase